MKIYSLHIEELRALHPLTHWLKAIPSFSTEVYSYRKDEDRWRIMAGKILLRYAFIRHGFPEVIKGLAYSEKGRPFLPGAKFDFNLSHSGDRVLVVLAEGAVCGVDIERHRKVNIDLFVEKFTPGEWEAITGASDPLKTFFKAWSVKESIIKGDGRGVAVLGKTEILSSSSAVCDGKPWWYESLSIDPLYSAAVACDRPADPEIIAVEGPELVALIPQ